MLARWYKVIDQCGFGDRVELSDSLLTVIAAMRSTLRPFPWRVNLTFQAQAGQVALDQCRAAGRQRLVRRLGAISPKAAASIASTLAEMFQR